MTVRIAAFIAYAVLVLGALVAPALALDVATARGGAARGQGLDLVVIGIVVAVLYVAYLQRVLRAPVTSRERTDRWLSAVHGLIVLWVAASVLPAVFLHSSTRLHARVVDAEWPVIAAWALVLAAAVVLAELVRRGSLQWLSRDPDDRRGESTDVRHHQPENAG